MLPAPFPSLFFVDVINESLSRATYQENSSENKNLKVSIDQSSFFKQIKISSKGFKKRLFYWQIWNPNWSEEFLCSGDNNWWCRSSQGEQHATKLGKTDLAQSSKRWNKAFLKISVILHNTIMISAYEVFS